MKRRGLPRLSQQLRDHRIRDEQPFARQAQSTISALKQAKVDPLVSSLALVVAQRAMVVEPIRINAFAQAQAEHELFGEAAGGVELFVVLGWRGGGTVEVLGQVWSVAPAAAVDMRSGGGADAQPVAVVPVREVVPAA